MAAPSNDDEQLVEQISQLSLLFDELCTKRHEAGAEEYGMFTFLQNDVIRMMMEEMIDIANYARMEFIKVMLLQDNLGEILTPEIGAQAFKGTGEGWKK